MQPEDQPTPAAALDALLNALDNALDIAGELAAHSAAAAYDYAQAHSRWSTAPIPTAAPTEAEQLASVTEYMEAKQARDSAWAAYCAAQTAYIDHIDSQSYKINRS